MNQAVGRDVGLFFFLATLLDQQRFAVQEFLSHLDWNSFTCFPFVIQNERGAKGLERTGLQAGSRAAYRRGPGRKDRNRPLHTMRRHVRRMTKTHLGEEGGAR